VGVRNGAAWLTQEIGLWVILRLCPDKRTVRFSYTEPEGGGSGEAESTLPRGVTVRGRCHTHPHLTKTEDFSTRDKRNFLRLQEARPGIAYYLMNPAQEIRRAITEAQFPAGTVVSWDSKVTP
jgi:hypothetical protein